MLKEKMKVFKSGNSNALRLSKKATEALGVEPGDTLNLVLSDNGDVQLKKITEDKRAVSDDFKKMLQKSYEENSVAMEMLKDL